MKIIQIILFGFFAKVYPDTNSFCMLDEFFHVEFRFDDLTDLNILQKIKFRIKEKLENERYIFLFNTKHIKICVYYKILYPPRQEVEEEDEEDEEEQPPLITIQSPFLQMQNLILQMKKEEEKQLINADKSFKLDECIICLTNLSNVLFCNCGHIPICGECKEIKPLDICLIC